MAGYRYVGGMRIAEALAPFLIGAALTLAVQIVLQFFITPRVDTRTRRSERFKRNVLDLGELLTSELEARAQQARLEQSWLRAMRESYRGSEFDLPHPPRAPLGGRLTRRRRAARLARSLASPTPPGRISPDARQLWCSCTM
jgi:hypothetical protein